MTDRRSFPRALALVLGAFFAMALTLTLISVAGATSTDPNEGHKVTLCHRTGSASNPYVEVTVDIASSGYVKGGHTGHDQIGNGLDGDIIPSYNAFAKSGSGYVDFFFPGKNMDTLFLGSTGRTILSNGCKLLSQETPSPTPEQSIGEPSESTSEPNVPNTAMSDGTGLTDDGWLLVYGGLVLIVLASAFLSAARSR